MGVARMNRAGRMRWSSQAERRGRDDPPGRRARLATSRTLIEGFGVGLDRRRESDCGRLEASGVGITPRRGARLGAALGAGPGTASDRLIRAFERLTDIPSTTPGRLDSVAMRKTSEDLRHLFLIGTRTWVAPSLSSASGSPGLAPSFCRAAPGGRPVAPPRKRWKTVG